MRWRWAARTVIKTCTPKQRAASREPNVNDEIARRATNFYSKLLLTTSNYICPVLIAAQSSCLLRIAEMICCARGTRTQNGNGKGLHRMYTAASIRIYRNAHAQHTNEIWCEQNEPKKGIAWHGATKTFSITNALHFILSDAGDDSDGGDVDGSAIFIRMFGLVECYGIFNVFPAPKSPAPGVTVRLLLT